MGIDGTRQDFRSEILRLFDGGVEISEISDVLGVPPSAVAAVLVSSGRQSIGYNAGNPPRREDRVLRDAVVKAYNEGQTIGAIAASVGLDTRDVWLIITQEGVPIRRLRSLRQLAKDRRDAEVVALYSSGKFEAWEVAQFCGISRPLMYRILRRYNVPFKNVLLSADGRDK